ncbi:glycosyltransferase [Patescibacteria group bacterium]|nr:glycosyltransferase [Patescibacteria group bacterium]MBU1029189.1 glycosyltransferase [Patescibacteria group bacterium]MBU1915597.1 glycosyltransferase [Patescibacteria group bacterium]MBU2214204.1 glycosyltransferase [Patescibacteria group bacterium]
MKILFASNLYGEQARGGAELVVKLEAVGLGQRGYEVAVVSAVPSSLISLSSKNISAKSSTLHVPGMVGRRDEAGVDHFTYFPPNLGYYGDLKQRSWVGRLIWHWLDIFNWRSANLLRRLIKVYRPKVVHTHNLMGLGFAIPNLLRQLNLRHVHTVHDVQLIHPSGLLSADWRLRQLHEWIYLRLMRFMMGSPAVVIFPSEFALKLHNQFGFFSHSTKTVIRNPAVDQVKDFKSREISNNNFIFVGQLEEHKGIFDLLTAWQCWSTRDAATLDIVGDGSLAIEVRSRAAKLEGVRCHGAVYGEQLTKLLDRAGYLVLPSRVIENAPMAILSAFSRGVPVLASRVGGIPEIVRDNENGFLFESANVDSLLTALQQAATSKERAVMSQRALSWIRSQSLEAHLDALESVYRI